MSQDRHSIAEESNLLTDAEAIARQEVANGVRQFGLALELIREHVKDPERPFRLRPFHVLKLHAEALRDIHPLAGTFRNTAVKIGGSKHAPPEAAMVSEEVSYLCDYVNEHFDKANAEHLAAYVLWKLNWIHPFSDGNGRTSRAVSYVVMSIKLDSLLPGKPTIPEQIASDKRPYYDALEAADRAWAATGKVDVSDLEAMLDAMLAKQLLATANEARARESKSE